MLDHDDDAQKIHLEENLKKTNCKPVYEFKDQNCYKLAKNDILNLSDSWSGSAMEKPTEELKANVNDLTKKENHTIMIIRAPSGSTIVNLKAPNC
jgi:hypothetical protein|tara:strand:- start:142 stop:426 length:285 start_codon:yes stop_codon:yes gene_type:complete